MGFERVTRGFKDLTGFFSGNLSGVQEFSRVFLGVSDTFQGISKGGRRAQQGVSWVLRGFHLCAKGFQKRSIEFQQVFRSFSGISGSLWGFQRFAEPKFIFCMILYE